MSIKQESIDAAKLQEVEDNVSEIASSRSDEKKKFTVIEPAVFLVYIATALASKTF